MLNSKQLNALPLLIIIALIVGACNSQSGNWQKLNQQFLDNNKTQANVVTTSTGLQYKVITRGVGLKPNAGSYVQLLYTGKLIDGTVFDTTVNDTTLVNSPRSMYVSSLVSGFQEALLKMNTGSTFEIYIPQSLGYGSTAMGNIPAYSTLIFDVQLVGFQ
ncbi:FKBP-type peptidyl-prolyl cis-trans isomerase [Microbacter margulisiae]|uniref:Peptidyl-prolyl cis-trans isomerase n=1 Tax=Microbacter margulisiae TaxID=1350067 RepID=A0A7W5H1I5_9PORP|nr:FKBP-type peptidyl-prolyl cis-trans isomerase [Microbacter margulisiae]MBB3186407.1 FKBP-type peptidyl-prolyl cis-trans isomerase [Microbacter margulisiae]